MAGWFDDFDIRKDAHKILLSVGVFVLGRFIYDKLFQEDFDLPISDEQHYTRQIKIPSGPRGIHSTLKLMAKVVRRDAGSVYVRNAALAIVKGCGGHQFDCELSKLFEFCRDRIIYRRDPAGVEWVQDARRTIEIGFGDCDDKSVLLCSLAAALGHKSRFVVCGFRPGRFSHVYTEVHTSKGWVPFDPTPENSRAGVHAQAPYRQVFEIFK